MHTTHTHTCTPHTLTHSLFKQREMYEVLRQIDNSVKFEVVLGSKKWEGLLRVQRGVKGHGEDSVADKPAAVLSPLVPLSESPPVCACVHVCMCVCVRACVSVCLWRERPTDTISFESTVVPMNTPPGRRFSQALRSIMCARW